MLRSHRLAASVSSLTVLFAAACGGGENTATTSGNVGGGSTGSGADTGGGAPGKHAEPPGPPAMMPADGMSDVTFAIKKLYLGDTDRSGAKSKDAWKQFGYDIDGLVSTGASKDLCKPQKNAKAATLYPDGQYGIDNSFGKNILTVLESITSDVSVKVNESISKGQFTVMFDMQKLGPGADQNPIKSLLYGGAKLDKAPAFDGNDTWPVLQELLADPANIDSAKVHFDNSYLVKNTWVSGSKGTVELNLTLLGFAVKLSIASAVITMDLDDKHQSAKNGTIAGVLATSALIFEIKKVAGAYNKNLCSGATIDNIVTLIQQASDILQNGTQDPAKDCDGISVGIGFDASLVRLGPIAPPVAVGQNPCP
jgi:hypothetical protein